MALYKVVQIPGKGLGCVALKDIKKGTLVLEETAQLIPTASDWLKDKAKLQVTDFHDKAANEVKKDYHVSIMDGFDNMSKDDQDEFMKLYNAYWDIGDLSDMSHDQDFKIQAKKIFDVLGRFKTNKIRQDILGIKASRFNHSCQPNAEIMPWTEPENLIKIIATKKIKKGQEITIRYGAEACMVSYQKRQEHLSEWKFQCNCDLCQLEASKSDTDLYDTFAQLQHEVNQLIVEDVRLDQKMEKEGVDVDDVAEACDNYRHIIENIKIMYKLAKEKHACRVFILEQITQIGFLSALKGYFANAIIFPLMGYQHRKFTKESPLIQFKKDCYTFAKISYEIIQVFGEDNSIVKAHKDIHLDFNGYFDEIIKKGDFSECVELITTPDGRKGIQVDAMVKPGQKLKGAPLTMTGMSLL